ncbi:hypothetical protein BDV37DRAFT_289590 [Aspergillus pseudonomiae]|uniref:Uncharacterized protein n=1 Tax=Aspergillus pseudonomiae TaxID=1506151 RepID=A0A5N7CUE7_9EURO|nr:uncharacterized protein BDV37DRAFT_289590 [Aspergillus pseudonomiae]KAE8397233.1 hypothetical protein BDV37DRAFT_289590 [Aspergillus pseudonomiae]
MVEPNHSVAHCQSSSQNEFPLGGINCFTVKIIPHLYDSLDATRYADLNQPFDISWMEYFYANDKLGKEITLRVTIADDQLKSEASKLHPLLYQPGIVKELRRDPRIGRYIAIIKRAIGERRVCSLAFRISGATPLDSTAV